MIPDEDRLLIGAGVLLVILCFAWGAYLRWQAWSECRAEHSLPYCVVLVKLK